MYRRQKDDAKLKNEQDKAFKDFDNVTYLHYLIEKSLECVIAYRDTYQKFVVEMELSIVGVPSLNITRSTNELDRLIKITDLNEYYHSYNNILRQYEVKNANATFNNGISILNLLFEIISTNIDVFESYSKCVSDSNEVLKKNIKALYVLTEQYSQLWPQTAVTKRLEEAKIKLESIDPTSLRIEFEKSHKVYVADVMWAVQSASNKEKDELAWEILKVSSESLVEYDTITANRSELKGRAESDIGILNNSSQRAIDEFEQLNAVIRNHRK